MGKIRYASFSETGERTDNEDYIRITGNPDDGRYLFVCCDGMGGHAMGDVDHSVWGDFIDRSIFSYQRDKADVEIHQFELESGDRILLCIDGVCQFIAPDILTRRSMDDKSPEDVANVIQFFCEKFSKDNYTGILVFNE